MSDSSLSRSVPSATSVLAESVRQYRRGFPGVARALLPVFAIFAVGQTGFALAGDPTDFRGYMTRAFALALVGLALLVMKTIALSGVVAVGEKLPSASLADIYRTGGRVFWSVVWVSLLASLTLSVAFVVGATCMFLGGVFVRFAAESLGSPLAAALTVLAIAAVASAVAALAIASKIIFAFPLVARGEAKGMRALETSAGLSEGRWWAVAWRLVVGLLVALVVALPFLLLDRAFDASWTSALLVAADFLVVAPFGAIFLTHLARGLTDTVSERAKARERRPWIRAFVWVGLAALALWFLSAFFR